MPSNPLRILLLCDFKREPERIVLRGLMKYAGTQGGCVFLQLPDFMPQSTAYAPMIINKAKELKVDAIFGKWPGIDTEAAKELDIPVFLRTHHMDYAEFPMLSGEYREIGNLAADYFIKQHYTNFAFFGYKGLLWSEERMRGLQERLKGKGMIFRHIEIEDISREWDKVALWIRSLPKPTALLACNDMMARIICEICLIEHINVPQQLAVLGVDDDEFMCGISYPELSSIKIDFERQGYELGEAIFKMVRSGEIYPARIKMRPTGIAERHSTLKHNIQDPYIAHIVDFIDNNYKDNIKLPDILSDIPLSQRAVELRFKKEMAPDTILSYLSRQRVKNMCQLLTTTDMKVNEAAMESGFDDFLNVVRTFRKYTGMTPTQYRESLRRR